MIVGSSMIFIDVTVLPVVLPTLQRELDLSDLTLQWILNAYTLILAVAVLGAGRIGDIWSQKKAYLFGLALFASASAICGISWTGSWIIAARALQGVGGAFLIPALQGILFSSFPPHQRGKAIGFLVSMSSIFFSIGPLLGGSLVEYLSWRFVFWINLPVAAIGLILGWIVIPKTPSKRETFDYGGFFLLSLAMAALVIAVMQSQTWGWTSPMILFLFAMGILLPILLFQAERKVFHPIVEINVIKSRSYLGGTGSIFLAQFLSMTTVYWAIYFQEVLEFSPAKAGSYAFLSNAPLLVAAPFAGYLVDKWGPKVPIALGFWLVGCSYFAWFFLITPAAPFWHLLIALIPIGIGSPMIYTPSSVALFQDVHADKRGAASGLNASLRQFGATLGLAVFGTMFTNRQLNVLSELFKKNRETSELSLDVLQGVLAKTPASIKLLATLPKAAQEFVVQSAKNAFVSAFDLINLASCLLALASLFFAWKVFARKRSK